MNLFDIFESGDQELDENLRKWFKDKWVRFGPDGEIRGDCARGDDSEGKPKCLPQSKAHALGKKGRASAAARKRREDPDPERRGPAKNVATKKKSNESVVEQTFHGDMMRQVYDKYRKPANPAEIREVFKFLLNQYNEMSSEPEDWENDLYAVKDSIAKLKQLGNKANYFDLADALYSYDTDFREMMIDFSEEELNPELVDTLLNDVFFGAKQTIGVADMGNYKIDLSKSDGTGVAEDSGGQRFIVTYTNSLSDDSYTVMVSADDEYDAKDKVRYALGMGDRITDVKSARGNEPTDREYKVFVDPRTSQKRSGIYDRQQGMAEAINPDITNPAFSHQQQIGDYLYVARYWSKGLKITAYDGTKKIGYAELMYQSAPFDDFADPKTTPKRIWLESEWTKVDPKYQRQGIMSTMYAYAKMLGNSVKPSELRSPDAKAAWSSWRQSGDAKHLTSNEGVAEGTVDDIEDTKQFKAAIALAKSQKAIRQAKDGKDAKYYADGTKVTPAEVARRAAERKAKKQGVAEGKMAELEMDLEDPEITDRQFEKMYGMTRKEAREQFSQTDMWAFPEIRDPNRPLHERGVAEAFGPLPKDNQQIRLGRHTVDIERVGLDKNYISFAWEDSQGQEHYEEIPVGDLGSYDDLIKRIKQEISYQERKYTDQGVAEGRVQYKEIEFVCANPDFCDATDPVKQQQLYKALTKIPGVIALYQDQSEYSEGQMSLSAIFKDPQARKQILQTAKKFGVAVDLEQSVDDSYVDRAIRGEHYGQIQGVAEGSTDTIYPNAEVIKSKNGRPVGEIYQDENGWGFFHYGMDSGNDFIDSREDAIQGLKDFHAENRGRRPDYTIKGVAEEQLDELKCWPGYHRVKGTKAGFPGSCAKNKTNEEVSKNINPDAVRRIQQLLNNKFDANLDVDGILGPLTLKSIKKFLPKSAEKQAPNPEKTTAVQGKQVKEEKCPHCGGDMVSEELMNEKKDACYYKVKSRYKVWPSAYASGALVKCRKKGASNWGTKSEGVAEGVAGDPYAFGDDDYMDIIQGMIDDNRRNMSPSRKPRVLAATKRYIEKNGGVFDPDVFEYAYDQIVEFSRGIDESQGVAEDQVNEKWSQKYKDSINCSNPKGFSQKAYCAGKKKNEDIAEGKEYYTVTGTDSVSLRRDFNMSKDRNGWYLKEGATPKQKLEAFRAFGSPKLKEYNLAAFSGGTQIKGEDNVISPVGSQTRGQYKK